MPLALDIDAVEAVRINVFDPVISFYVILMAPTMIFFDDKV